MACIPVQPSLPIVAISMTWPSAYTATTETTPLSGKKTWSSELSASMRTCACWQRMCSSSGISRLRLRGGRASKSRLPRHFDETFIPLNRAWSALVPTGWSDASLLSFPSTRRDMSAKGLFASRFWWLQSPLFLYERTSLVATCSPNLAERRRKAEAITHHVLDDRDGFREAQPI